MGMLQGTGSAAHRQHHYASTAVIPRNHRTNTPLQRVQPRTHEPAASKRSPVAYQWTPAKGQAKVNRLPDPWTGLGWTRTWTRDSRSPLKRPGISDMERNGLGWAGAEKRTAQCPQTARRTGRRKTFNRSNREVEPPARARSGRGLQVLSAQPGRDVWVFALARSHGQEPARRRRKQGRTVVLFSFSVTARRHRSIPHQQRQTAPV